MNENKKSKFIPNKEEIETERKKILFEMNKTIEEIKNERKKKLFLILSIGISIILFIKIIFGTIDIPNVFKYPFNKTRFYKVTLNGELISHEYYLTQKIPIIPYLVYLKREYFDGFITKDDIDTYYYDGDDLDKFIINIESYSCYFKGHQTKCKDENQVMKKNNDTEFAKLEIWRNTKPIEKIYEGKFISDITSYIKDNGKGVYTVTIYANHSFIETKVVFAILIGRK